MARLAPKDYTYEKIEVLDMMQGKDRERLAELRNMEEHGKIEIVNVDTIESPRSITLEGQVYNAKIEKLVEYMTVSKPLLESDATTEV